MPTSSMGSGTKYLALEEFLMDKTENITLTFIEINEIIGEKASLFQVIQQYSKQVTKLKRLILKQNL